MNMRRGLGLGWALVTVAVAGVVAWFAYHAGLATTITSSGVAPAIRDGGYYYAEPWGFGFGLFPILFFVLLLFFVFRRRRWGGHWGGHGYYGGYKGGRGWGDGPPQEGHGLPPVIDEKLKAWHQSAHGNAPAEPSADNPGSPPGGVSGGPIGQA